MLTTRLRRPPRFASCISAVLLTLVLSACASSAPGQIFVRVIPPSGDWPPERLVLEVGGQAWQMEQKSGGGVVTYNNASNPQSVRLVNPAHCQVLYRFDALVGHKYTLRVSFGGGITLLDDTQGVYESGPGLTSANPSGCPS
jgi:hypothetical protein